MSGAKVRIPASSQTVGPYFKIGLEYLIERTPALEPDSRGTIELRGRVLDRDGAPVSDAMLEFWNGATIAHPLNDNATRPDFPTGFRRAATDAQGKYTVVIERPAPTDLWEEHPQAPHLLVLVFARGLLRHLISRVYLGDEQGNENDPMIVSIPKERRASLIAQPVEGQVGFYLWDVILQGTGETVFFAW